MTRARIPLAPGRWCAVLLLGGLVAGLTACSDDAADDATDPASSHAPSGGSAEAEALAQSVNAAVEQAGPAVVSTVGEREGGARGTGDGIVRFGDDYALDLTTGGTLPPVRILVVDGRSYARPAEEVEGKAWVRLDDASTENQVAALFGPILESLRDTTDVEGMAALLTFASQFEELGPQEVDGEPFTAYRASFDKEALIASMSEPDRERAREQMITADAVYTIYLDDQGRPRRVVTDSTVNGVPTTQTTDFTDWGADATFEAPPAQDVVSLTEASG